MESTIMVSVETLRRYPFFAGASPSTLRDIAEISEETTFAAGEPIFRQGDQAQLLYFLMEGEVEVVIEFPEAGKEQAVETLVPGDMVGWSALVPPYERTFMIRPISNVRALTIDGPRLRELCERDPSLGHRLLQKVAAVLAKRLDAARVQLASTAT